MPGISETIARLSKREMATADSASASRLSDLPSFGPNSGALRAKYYVPRNLSDQAPLVVVLHGCTQTGKGYDLGSGWSQAADRYGFALLFPEQQRQNNPNLCFNWFSSEDNRRDKGEAQSIRQMIETMIDLHQVDPTRVFVTGLSAGGAMASVMLASYPELFAGGAIIAGLPYGCANSIPQAFEAMRGLSIPDEKQLSELVRVASDHAGPWPTISIWHGTADTTVNPTNAAALVNQWRALHQTDSVPSRVEAVDGYPRRVWCNGEGREVIEEYSITGMSHGTPLDTAGPDGCGTSGAFMLDVSISSTLQICRFWGLTSRERMMEQNFEEPATIGAGLALLPPALCTSSAAGQNAEHQTRATGAPAGVGRVIEGALRAAGLLR